MKLKVSIEERLCRTIEVEVPNGSTLSSPAVKKETEKVIESYRDRGEIVLNYRDFTGQAQFCVELENGETTGWYN